MPNGAESQTARNPEQRQMPDSAESQTATKCGTARSGERGNGIPPFVAVRDLAPFGISRRLGFSAVRDFAPSGISRR